MQFPPTSASYSRSAICRFTQAAFEQYIADLEATQGPASLSRKKLGDNYASMLVLEQQAKANNLESSPDVIRLLAIDRMQILSNAEFAKLKTNAAPTAEEIKAYYNEHLDDFETADVRRIFIWSGDPTSKDHSLTPQQAKALADRIRVAIKSGDAEVDKVLAGTQHGKEDVVADPQPLTFRRGELAPVMNDAIFALKQGEWKEFNSGPAEYVFIHLVKLGHEDLKDATPEIAKKVQNEKLREELSTLKSKTGVWMDENYFASKTPASATNSQPQASGQSKNSTEREEKSE